MAKKIKEKVIEEDFEEREITTENLIEETEFLSEQDHNALLMSMHRIKNCKLESAMFKQDIAIRRLQAQMATQKAEADIKELTFSMNKFTEKLNDEMEKHKELIADLSEKYDLPNGQWGYDEDTGEISIIEKDDSKEE